MPRSTPQLLQDARMWASRALVRSLAPPDWLSVNVTLRCNLRCVMCTTCYDSPELTTRELIRLVDEAADMGVRVFNPLGGEPLVRDDLEEVLAHAVARGMFVTLTTNGTLLRPERAARLARLSPARLHVNLSLDGAEAAHDRVRGAGSFSRAMAGYRALRAADAAHGNPVRTLRANVLLHRGNLHGYEAFLGWLEDEGFSGVQQLTLFRDEADATVGGMWFQPEDLPALDALCTRLADDRAAGRGPARLLVNAPEDLRAVPRYYREGLSPREAPCWAGWKELYVNADGRAVMCDGTLDFLAGAYGDVRRQSLRALWRSDALRARREVVKACTTPCIQGCYLRRESDALAPIAGALAANAARPLEARAARAVARLRPARPLDMTLLFEASARPSDDAGLGAIWRPDVPAGARVDPATLRASPDALRRAWSHGWADTDHGFGGEELLAKVLEDLDRARLRPRALWLGWRGDAGLHPALDRLVACGLGRGLPVHVVMSDTFATLHPVAAAHRAHGGARPSGACRVVTWDARVLDDPDDVRQTRVLGNAWEEDAAAVLTRTYPPSTSSSV
jgi:MoaA/NifB/PqqE/SkfB family radical SAM enzyme